MVQFLTTAGVNSAIETIIRKANKKLVLVSPYLQLSQILLERLQNADDRVEEIVFIYGKNQLNDREWNNITQLKRLKLYYYENLHAKCYFNDSMMVITSMNLYEHSIHNNREIGILLTREDEGDSELFTEALLEVQEIIKNAENRLPERHEPEEVEITTETKELEVEIKEELHTSNDNGYCLRCREEIKFDLDRPLCLECYNVWKEYCNPNYLEFYCHQCGQNYKSTINKPLCPICFHKVNSQD